MFGNIYEGKKVIITGNTGFKGSWLTVWLLKLGAEVIGISKDIPTDPSMFKKLKLLKKIKHYSEDIRNLDTLIKIISKEQPDFVFHLAAQAIVSTSYSNPIETISTNVIGTNNVLEVLRIYDKPCVGVIITSDKCYDNVEWVWGYRETDMLGGKDIYSGSKAAAEAVFKSYYHSFFKTTENNILIATARAGNVIGGGDWALDRIVPDCMRSWSENKIVDIRNPHATRPWQHVLEPLSGYLSLGKQLIVNHTINGESFNFGPKSDNNYTVKKLLEDLSSYWNFDNYPAAFSISDSVKFYEAGLLKLNCDKALTHLKWLPTLDYAKLIEFVGEWYFKYYRSECDMFKFTSNQIDEYINIAKSKNIEWIE